MGRDYLVGKSRRLKEGQIDSRWYELPVPDKEKTCKRQNKKSWHYNDNLDKWVVWKGAASVHGWIEVESVWDTIRWAQCDSRNAGHKNADNDKQDEIFFSEIHILWSIVRQCFETFPKVFPLYPHCGTKSRILYHSVILMHSAIFFNRRFLHQHSQSPTKSMDYNFVPFCKLFAIGNRIPYFGIILDFTFRVDVLNDQTGSTHHGLFTVPGFHAHGLKDFEISNETSGLDFKIRLFYTQSVAGPWFFLNLNAFPASSIDVRQDKLQGGHNSPRIPVGLTLRGPVSQLAGFRSKGS